MGIGSDIELVHEISGEEVPESRVKHRWAKICVCGHEDQMHGAANGGRYGLPTGTRTVDGCRGASPNKDEPPAVRAGKSFEMPATCPCTKVRPIAEVDRPWRYFRQKTWTKDTVHPFTRGLKAMLTGLSKRKTVDDPEAERDRRFRWIEGARKCAVCGAHEEKDAVWPRYVDAGRASEMRCARHMPVVP